MGNGDTILHSEAVGMGGKLDEMGMSSLDVGSYCKKRASLGVDLRVERGSVDVRASAECLPFRSKVFESALSSHVIEHVEKPWQLVSEIRRVTRGKVLLEFPKPEYGDVLKWSIYEYVMQLPFSLLDPRLILAFLRQLYWIDTMKPATYHRWLIYPERLMPGVVVMEDSARVLQPLRFLTQGRKSRFFKAIQAKRRIVGLRITI